MITTGAKWYFGLGFVSLVIASAYGWTTGGNGLGPLTLGYKGGVGDHFGYGVLVAGATISVFLGVVSLAVRDADAAAVAQLAGTDSAPVVVPSATSYWPAIAAFGVALVVIGLVSSTVMFVFGLVALGIVLIEWAVQTWADHATGDPAVNRQIRNRLMNPVEFPAAGVLAAALLVVAFSRVFLAVLVASRPRLNANVIVGVLLVAAVAVVGAGIAGAVAGEREFHQIGEEGEEHEEGAPAPPSPGMSAARAEVVA
jgi:hypothetical protein